ncbi:MAG: hypothetical protein K9N55_00140 [Phycisphaerae bacterium]|nr:hypothetical protein [Phycisphaerae bacterium]
MNFKFSFMALIVIFAFVLLLVFIIKRAGKKALILIPIMILGVLFVPFISWQKTTRVSSLYSPDFGMLQHVQNHSAIWNEAIDDYLEADHYASMQDAARFLAKTLVGEVQNGTTCNRMVVYGLNPVTSRALNTFSDVIRSQLNLSDVRAESIRPSVLPSEPNLAICILDVPKQQHSERLVNGLNISNSTGTLRLHVENPSDIMDRSVEFLEKDWINSLSRLQNQGHSAVMVARSSDSCMDEAEAIDQAMAQAATMVQNLLRQAYRTQPVLDQEIKVTPQDLLASQLVADQFTQSLRTSTARVWRHAVLLSLQPGPLESLLQQKTRQIQHMHRNWARSLMSLAGLALVVFIVYIFLNAATKGYYVWSLRVIAAVTILGIVVVLLLS